MANSTSCGKLHRMLALVLLLAPAGPCIAQGWKPDRNIEIVIGTSPGGALDRTGRTLQRVLQDRKLSEVPVVVNNRPGGGGGVGLAYVAQQADGSHTMITGQILLTNHIMGRSRLNHTDFTPIAILRAEYIALAVRADSPIATAREFVERLRKDPTSLSVATGTGVGTATHASFAHAMSVAGVDLKRVRQVAFGSGGDSLTALLGGHVDAMSTPVPSILEQARAGKVRIIAVGAPRRVGGALADVPTWTELGIKSSVDVWHGLVGPKAMTPVQIAYWDQMLARATKDEAWQKELERTLSENVYRNSADTAKLWQAEYGDMKELFTTLGLAKPAPVSP